MIFLSFVITSIPLVIVDDSYIGICLSPYHRLQSLSASAGFEAYSTSDRYHLHSSQDLCELYASTINTRFYGAFRYLQDVNYLLVAQFLDIAEDDARPQVVWQLVNAFLHLASQLLSLDVLLGRAANRPQMILVVVDGV